MSMMQSSPHGDRVKNCGNRAPEGHRAHDYVDDDGPWHCLGWLDHREKYRQHRTRLESDGHTVCECTGMPHVWPMTKSCGVTPE